MVHLKTQTNKKSLLNTAHWNPVSFSTIYNMFLLQPLILSTVGPPQHCDYISLGYRGWCNPLGLSHFASCLRISDIRVDANAIPITCSTATAIATTATTWRCSWNQSPMPSMQPRVYMDASRCALETATSLFMLKPQSVFRVSRRQHEYGTEHASRPRCEQLK